MKPLLLACLLLAAPFWNNPALAQRAPREATIVWGWGDTVDYVCDLPPGVRVELGTDSQLVPAVGFCYWRFCIFADGFNFWTWNGRYVIYHGSRFVEIPEEDFVQILGEEKFASLGKPLAYRVPFGLVTLLAIAAALAVAIRYAGHNRVRRLLQDQRYQQAIQIYNESLDPDSEPSRDDKQIALAAAADSLVKNHCLRAETAMANLRLILAELDRGRSYELRDQAQQHEEESEWEQAIELYQQASDLQREWDLKDYAFLLKCIDRVRTKQARVGDA